MNNYISSLGSKALRNSLVIFPIIITICVTPVQGFQANNNTNTCPSAKPYDFLDVYSNKIDLQIKYVIYPLKYTYTVNNPASQDFLQEKILYVNDVSKIPYVKLPIKPIYPNKDTQKREGLKHVIRISVNRFMVNLHKPDTDYINLFLFVWKNDCWMLKSISSKSL